MAKQACKCKPTECEECPEWIFTFADLVMLMMGFFVILWVLKPAPGASGSNDNDEQLIKIIAAARDYFSFIPDSQNPDKVDLYRLAKKLEEMKPLKDPGSGGPTKIERRGAEGDESEVLSIRRGQQAATGSRILFEMGNDALTAESRGILDQTATLIKGHKNVIMVKGHTSSDDLPDSATAQQKLDLSIRRAKVVADHLVERGVEPDILRVQGCSTYEPVAQRAYTADSRRVNRRVEIESTNLLVSELQDRPAPASPAPRPGGKTGEERGAAEPSTSMPAKSGH